MSKIEGFTPGPWVSVGSGVYTQRRPTHQIVSWTNNTSVNEQEAEANARLIAAAPLLPRLVQALRTINATDDHQQWQTIHDLLTEAEEYGL